MAKGSNISLVGQKQISWFTTPAGAATTAAPKPAANGTASQEERHDDDEYAHAHSSALETRDYDEEVVVGGWGDDEDGMGLL